MRPDWIPDPCFCLRCLPLRPHLHAQVGLLVEATLDLYRKVVGELLPTPAKPHYVFSILHVSQVFQVN